MTGLRELFTQGIGGSDDKITIGSQCHGLQLLPVVRGKGDCRGEAGDHHIAVVTVVGAIMRQRQNQLLAVDIVDFDVAASQTCDTLDGDIAALAQP